MVTAASNSISNFEQGFRNPKECAYDCVTLFARLPSLFSSDLAQGPWKSLVASSSLLDIENSLKADGILLQPAVQVRTR